MIRATFWLQLLLVVFLLKQSDAAAYRSGEMQEEIDKQGTDIRCIEKLKRNNGEHADNYCVSRNYIVHVSSE